MSSTTAFLSCENCCWITATTTNCDICCMRLCAECRNNHNEIICELIRKNARVLIDTCKVHGECKELSFCYFCSRLLCSKCRRDHAIHEKFIYNLPIAVDRLSKNIPTMIKIYKKRVSKIDTDVKLENEDVDGSKEKNLVGKNKLDMNEKQRDRKYDYMVNLKRVIENAIEILPELDTCKTNHVVFIRLWISIESEIKELEEKVEKIDKAEKLSVTKSNQSTPRTKTGMTGDIVSKSEPTAETTNADAVNDPKKTQRSSSEHNKEKEPGSTPRTNTTKPTAETTTNADAVNDKTNQQSSSGRKKKDPGIVPVTQTEFSPSNEKSTIAMSVRAFTSFTRTQPISSGYNEMKRSEKQMNKFTLMIRELETAHNELEEMYEMELRRGEELKLEVDRMEKLIKDLEEKCNKIEQERLDQILSNETEIKRLQSKFESSEVKWKEDIQKLEERENETRDDFDKLLCHNKERDVYFKKLQIINEKIMTENKKTQADIAEARDVQVSYLRTIDQKTNEIEVLLEKFHVVKAEASKAIKSENEATRQLQLAKVELDARLRRITDMDKSIKSLKSERDDLQTRLTGFAGSALAEPKRPTRIAEMYGELYDSEWAEAMEVTDTVKKHFPNKSVYEIEEITIHHLRRILTTCYQGCLQRARQQVKDVAAILGIKHTCNEGNDTAFNKLYGIMTYRSKIADDYVKQLAFEKAFSDTMLDKWEYPFKNKAVMNELTCGKFNKRCLEICWYMVIQNPVMCLDDEIPPGTAMDKDIYREFTKSGDKVVYVVWPALFLHKDGPVLYKGVVQVK